MTKIIIYHNPRCSKSCAALDILQKQGLEITVINILTNPPSFYEIKHIASMLNKSPYELLRTHEKIYQELCIEDQDFSADDIIELMIDYPQLIQRPIVLFENKAVIARPPDILLELI